ncbi:hypothetical protein H633G_06411 [Metarhizium anisopliae BRIP 53284]|nr:hypothetical protein H633G_06411 [Metarhizium anisopliae BRIP 53284]
MLNNAIIAVAALAALRPVDAIWPVPQQISTGQDVLFVDKSIQVTYNGEPVSYDGRTGETKESPSSSSQVVHDAVARSLTAIFEHGLVPWMLNPPGSDFEPALDGGAGKVTSLTIKQTGEDNATVFKPLAGQVDESYSLHLEANGEASIEAVTSTGLVRGLESFTQLFFKHSSGDAFYTKQAPVSIQDAPRFPHRGLVLDLSRHWFAVDDIKRTIDGLAMNKMNVIHLHITNTQSWPLEIPALPKLAEKGRYAPGLTYSPQAIQEIQEYGVARGVQVLLEIDMPGHVGIDKAYPGLSVAYNEKPYDKYCAQPPCGALKLNNTDVENFISTLFDDLLPRLSPYSAYFHTGGDEYKATNSLLDPDLQTDNMTLLQPLLQRFLDHAHNNIRGHGLVPIVWEEMVEEWAANWLDFKDGPSLDAAYPFADYCSPTKNWRLIYSHDPVENMTAEAAANVIGGEVAVWTEMIDPVSLDTLAWPRAAAAGEAWWSGRKDAEGNLRSVFTARPRLEEMRERMLARGVRGAVISQLFCGQSPLEDCAA